jgi:hypothetical protein
MTPADAATVKDFYSGQLMQFASGVDIVDGGALCPSVHRLCWHLAAIA